ncbi:uncharacterized protein KY384_001777 [Bacidia gigantensis]|uniref:uncharacterized protein n=1 Tax=Bacidia gigantensis TaxID=2732470 RepID=UPI001D04243F|nr:uncharacterized protein KY384_001777 [Bacidia gigantensis]KAG8532995.1 hypothetical protein KY384_001777 [Bacidia gigantensis]
MPADQEGILSMEKFDGLIEHAECNQQGLVLTFEDDSAFTYAQKVWDWVNGADNHTFLMVAGKGDCGDNDRRIPYSISSIAYDVAQKTARLTGNTGNWKDLIHTYELRVGKISSPDDVGLKRRDYTKDASFDFNQNFDTKVKVKTGPVFAELVCDPCYTAGTLDMELIIKTKFLVPVDLQFRVVPHGLKSHASFKFEVASDFGSKFDGGDKVSLAKIPLAGVTIPGDILTIGPVIDVQAGIEITGFEGGVSFRTGFTGSLPDSAILNADLLHPDNNEFSGWTPKIDTEPLIAQARVAAYVKLFLDPTLALEAEALGIGFETGFDLKFPFVELRGEAIVSPKGGACKAGDSFDSALRLRTSYGFELKFTAGKINGEQPVNVILGAAPALLRSPRQQEVLLQSLPVVVAQAPILAPQTASPEPALPPRVARPVAAFLRRDNVLMTLTISKQVYHLQPQSKITNKYSAAPPHHQVHLEARQILAPPMGSLEPVLRLRTAKALEVHLRRGSALMTQMIFSVALRAHRELSAAPLAHLPQRRTLALPMENLGHALQLRLARARAEHRRKANVPTTLTIFSAVPLAHQPRHQTLAQRMENPGRVSRQRLVKARAEHQRKVNVLTIPMMCNVVPLAQLPQNQTHAPRTANQAPVSPQQAVKALAEHPPKDNVPTTLMTSR